MITTKIPLSKTKTFLMLLGSIIFIKNNFVVSYHYRIFAAQIIS